jgi:hypothetical protein
MKNLLIFILCLLGVSAMGQNPVQRNSFTTNAVPAFVPATVWVNTNGNDAIAIAGDFNMPAQSGSNAIALMPPGGTMILTPGQFFGAPFDFQSALKFWSFTNDVTIVATGAIITNAPSGAAVICKFTGTNVHVIGGDWWAEGTSLNKPFQINTNANTALANYVFDFVHAHGASDGWFDSNTNTHNVTLNQCTGDGNYDTLRFGGITSGTNGNLYVNGGYFSITNSAQVDNNPKRTAIVSGGLNSFFTGTYLNAQNGNSETTALRVQNNAPTVCSGCTITATSTNGGTVNSIYVETGGVLYLAGNKIIGPVAVQSGGTIYVSGRGQFDPTTVSNSGTIIYIGETNTPVAGNVLGYDGTQPAWSNVGTIVGSVASTGNNVSAGVSITNIYTPPAQVGGSSYIPSIYIQLTTAAGAGTFSVNDNWFDDVGTASGALMAANKVATVTTPYWNVPSTSATSTIHVANGHAITNIISFSSLTGSPVLNYYIWYQKTQ